MKIFVINPNTSETMTDHIRTALESVKRPDTELSVSRDCLQDDRSTQYDEYRGDRTFHRVTPFSTVIRSMLLFPYDEVTIHPIHLCSSAFDK